MSRRKRAEGEPVTRTLKMPPWLSAEVEKINALTGMTQAKITGILEELLFTPELAMSLRGRVYEHLGELLLPGDLHAIHQARRLVEGSADQAPGAPTPYQVEQAALFGVDPADVVIPAEQPEGTVRISPPPMPVGEDPDPDDELPF